MSNFDVSIGMAEADITLRNARPTNDAPITSACAENTREGLATDIGSNDGADYVAVEYHTDFPKTDHREENNRVQNVLHDLPFETPTSSNHGITIPKSTSAIGTVTEGAVDDDLPQEYLDRREELKQWLQTNGTPEEATPGFVGLKNQGATCYLNSLLQSFFSLPEFRNAIADWRFDLNKHGSAEMCIPYQIQLLFAQLHCSRKNAVSTTGFTKSCGFTQRDVFQQHDIQELCRILFDALESSDKKLFQKLQALFEVSTTEFLRSTNTTQEFRSEKSAKNLDLSVPLEDKDESLEEALSRMVVAEEMIGENRWFCEEAGMKVDAERGVRFEHLPDVLSIHLMRFVYDRLTYRRKKLTNDVDIPLELDLTELNSTGVYSLASVCFHTGSGYGGHYYAWTRDPEDDTWIVCNDEHKAPLDSYTAGEMKQTGRLKGDLAAPYFLLYRRKVLPVPPAISNPHEETFVREENKTFDDMHRLYQIHREVRTVQIFSMEGHLHKVNNRIFQWMRQYHLHLQVESPSRDVTPNAKEVEALGSQLLKNIGRNLYYYDPNSCTAMKEVGDDSVGDCYTSLLSCPGVPPSGETMLMLWKEGKFHYDSIRQCDSDEIENVAKEMYSEPSELLVVSGSTYMRSTAQVEQLCSAWRKKIDLVIIDAHACVSTAEKFPKMGGSYAKYLEENEDLVSAVARPRVWEEPGPSDECTMSETISFREVFENCMNGLLIEHSTVDSGETDDTIVAKRQWTAFELKTKICAKHNLDPVEHHLRRSARAQMIKDESLTLDAIGFTNHTPVFLCSGEVVQVGFVSFNISLERETKMKTVVGSVVVSDAITVRELREQIFDLIVDTNLGVPGIRLTSPSQIRVRSENHIILRDRSLFCQGNYLRSQLHQQLTDGKTLIARILPVEEDLSDCHVAPISRLDIEKECTVSILDKELIVSYTTGWDEIVDDVFELVKEYVAEMDDLEIAMIPTSCLQALSFQEALKYEWRGRNVSFESLIRDRNTIVVRSRQGYQQWKEQSSRELSKNGEEPGPLAICFESSNNDYGRTTREKPLVISVNVRDESA